MADPFLGELRIFSFNFPPKGWAFCNGQLLPINQNQALFSLLGTTYGGNGQVNFALPNLRGQVPIHVGSGFTQGQAGGSESVTISQQQMPEHIHLLQANQNNADAPVPSLFAATNNAYTPPSNLTTLRPDTVTNVGGSQPHQNMQPYLALNFCIALQGIFPSRN
ncbi:MAG TPA: tail fiber protein [Allosphingosinicella sp.]|jgi:microcystin-dependent protein